MTSGNIGIGDYSEIIATKIGDVTDLVPNSAEISLVHGVEAGVAAVYKSDLTKHLREFAKLAERGALRVEEFSEAARSAVEAIRAADDDAEESTRAVISDIDALIKREQNQRGAQSRGGSIQTNPLNSAGNQELR